MELLSFPVLSLKFPIAGQLTQGPWLDVSSIVSRKVHEEIMVDSRYNLPVGPSSLHIRNVPCSNESARPAEVRLVFSDSDGVFYE